MRQPSAALLALLVACGGSGARGSVAAAEVEALRASAAELARRPEHAARSVEVQHLLISFAGTPRTRATRSRAEAEELAAELWRRALDGEDFDRLVEEYTDDRHPGRYSMTPSSRAETVRGFGDVAWRLVVEEIGVSAYDPASSPFGWHLIKRLR